MSFISIASGVAWATLLLLPLFPLRLFFYDSSRRMEQKSWISSLVVQLRQNEQNDFKMPSMRTECSNHIRNHFLFLPAQCLHCLFVFFVWISQVLICQRLPTVWLCVCRWTSVWYGWGWIRIGCCCGFITVNVFNCIKWAFSLSHLYDSLWRFALNRSDDVRIVCNLH